MNEQLRDKSKPFFVFRDKATCPDKPLGLNKMYENLWEYIEARWDAGLEHFELLKNDPRGRQRLEVLQEQQRHRCTVDYVMLNLIGMAPRDQHVRENLHTKIFQTRKALGVGREVAGPRGQKVVYFFTSEEIAQLMVGFLAQFKPTDDINQILYGR